MEFLVVVFHLDRIGVEYWRASLRNSGLEVATLFCFALE